MKVQFLLLLITISALHLSAQQTAQSPEQFRYFTFKYSPKIVTNSLYNDLKVIDLRKDTLRLGQCQFGLLNRKLTITPKPALSIQLAQIISRATNQSANNGKM